MAPTIEGQAEINGLLVGPGTPYDLVVFNPWRRRTRADQGGPLAWNHGAWSGAEWRTELVVDIIVHYGATTTAGWRQLDAAAAAAFAPVGDSATDREIRFIRGGEELLIFGRPRTFEPEIRPGARRAVAAGTFVALDPFIFSGDLVTVADVPLPTFVGGLAVPFLVPTLVDSDRVGGEALLTNEGTADTKLLIRIDGPVDHPVIALQRPDGIVQTLRFLFAIPSTQWIEVDTAARTVFLNGLPQSSRRGQVITEGGWPVLPPGTSTLRFDATDRKSGASMDVSFRSAWF